MKKQSFINKAVRLFVLSAALFTFTLFTTAAQTPSGVKNIVLVHGAFADGSGWEGVYKILTARGYNVTVVQNPLSSLEDDVAAAKLALDKQDGPAVLVGHSWGGSVITQAGNSPKVASLVYVAAFQPEVGETTLDLVMSAPPAPENGILPPDEKGYVYYDKAKFHKGFAGDLSKEKADFMYASQGAFGAKGFGTPITEAAWKTKPTWGVIATEDKSINPDILRRIYKRSNTKITEVKGSHVIFISQPKAVADVIEAAAKGAK
ncbi:MAG: alpha/beta hydrolase [Chitinophagaceae bacterium]|nr:MAG: alpha/beta hydrolase [Chitinophagaceae bacterium]